MRGALAAALRAPWLRDPLWTRARMGPSLDLDFAGTSSLRDRVSGQNLVTFTRASDATYVDSQGIIRTAPTNLLLRSEELNTTWTLSGVQAFGSGSVVNATTAPDGTATADKIVETSGGTTHLVAQAATIASATAYTISVFAKAAERSRVGVYFGGAGGSAQGVVINLNTGGFVANIVAPPTAYTVTPFPNGWYRIAVTSTSAGTAGTPSFYVCNDAGAFSYSGDGTSGIFLWGAQLEVGSTATEYLPTSATVNGAPRITNDPTTGRCLGLLIEEARTNLLLRSEEFDNASWIGTRLRAFGSGSVANATTAPNSIASADKIVEDTTASNTHFIYQSVGVTSGTTYAFSAYVKAAERTSVMLQYFNTAGAFSASSAIFNLSTGALTSSTVLSASITPLSNGWFRITATQSATATATGIVGIYLISGTTTQVYTGDGTSGLYLWGAQLEAGAFPTSYIPTTSASVTRAADIATISGTNFSGWYRQDEMTIYVDTLREYAVPAGTFPMAVDARVGTDRLQVGYLTEGAASCYVQVGGVGQAEMYPGSGNVRRRAIAFAAKADDFGIVLNGGTALTDASGSMPASMTSLSIGSIGSVQQLGGTISRLTYWPRRLSDPTLQEITR